MEINYHQTLIQRLEQLIERHFREHRDPEFYADALCISSRQLSRICLQYTHKTPSEWVRERVYQEAEYLLKHTELPANQICYELGLCDPAHFTKSFKRFAGLSPSAYRQHHLLEVEVQLN